MLGLIRRDGSRISISKPSRGSLDILRHNVFSSQEFLSAQSSQSLIHDKADPTAGRLSFVTDMTLRVESHSSIPIDVLPHESVCVYLQPVIDLFRYWEGAIIQHRPEDLPVRTFQLPPAAS